MRVHSRVRRTAKWAGLVVCILIVLADMISLVFVAYYQRGTVQFRFGFQAISLGVSPPPGFYWEVNNLPWSKSAFYLPLVEYLNDSERYLSIPLWLLFVLAAIPTAWMSWHDRRSAQTVACRCGFDPAGESGGVCPDCAPIWSHSRWFGVAKWSVSGACAALT